MRYKQTDVVFHRPEWHLECKGHTVVEAKSSAGMWNMPHYKVESKETKSGFVWLREWMLK
jgi:hypothetical protein